MIIPKTTVKQWIKYNNFGSQNQNKEKGYK